MRQVVKVTLFSLLSVLVFNAQATESHHSDASAAEQSTDQEKVISTKGVVKEIDLANKKLTITHEAIPSINWPAMTMRFTFSAPEMVKMVKVGSKVNFDFVQQGNISLLKHIEENEL